MKKTEKILAVQDLTERLKTAKSLVLTDYRGLNVAQIQGLRTLVEKAGGEFMVVKNTLLAMSMKNADLPIPEESLKGPTAIALAFEDELAPIKAVNDFVKTAGLPFFKSGLWQRELITADEVKNLANLPGRNELLAKLVGILSGDSFRLVNVLSVNQQKLIYILKTKSEGGEN